MRILLVTGRRAEFLTRSAAEIVSEKTGLEVDVEVVPVDLGAFVTTRDLEGLDLSGYDLVLVPGLARGNYSRFGNVAKGTRSVADLPLLAVEDFEGLSPTLPADRLLDLTPDESVYEEGEPDVVIGGLGVGGDLRMRVLGEIVDATDMEPDDLLRRANRYVSEGVDMVDLGVPLDASPGDVERAAALVSEELDVPVSVDTMEPGLIEAALPHVDLVLSADGEVLDEVGEEMAEAGVAVVVVPGGEGLDENLETAAELGLDVLADPVLDPPLHGLVDSLERYRDEGQDCDVPLFFGVGNVAELIDADSVGVNALLAAAGQEVGAAVVFTPEHSVKARGSVRELAVAVRMMHLADRESRFPKDLGLDLLVLKDKVRGDEPVESRGEVVEAEVRGYEMDPLGHFRVGVDREEEKVVAVFHPSDGGDGVTIRGDSAAAVASEVVARGLVSLIDHAAYLGQELEKAEIALVIGKSYRQDSPLFERKEF